MIEKVRNYKYDNLKCLMIFCVVFAHCLELIENTLSHMMYAIIYTFSMPVFVYISGYFSKFKKENIFKYCGIYLICQIAYCLVDIFLFDLKCDFFMPNWLLWYMFALIVWTLSLKIFHTTSEKKAWIIILITFIASLIAGFFDNIGYEYSLSRIITFFPYFLLGYYTKNENLKFTNLKMKNGKCNKALIIFWGIIAIISFSYFWSIKDELKSCWLYGAMSYNKGEYTVLFKSMWIIVSLFEITFFDNIMINKKLPLFSIIGANTLNIYLIHGIILKYFKYNNNIFIFSDFTNLLLAFIVTLAIMSVFGYILRNKKKSY